MSGRGAIRRWSLATLLPWLAAGVAAACALGESTVTGADRPHRLGLLPPPWVFVLAVTSAVLAAVILRRTHVPSAPLLLGAVTLVPWLPIPLPAVALAFAGPLRWSLWTAAGVLLAASAVSGSGRMPGSRLTATWTSRTTMLDVTMRRTTPANSSRTGMFAASAAGGSCITSRAFLHSSLPR